MTTPLYPVEAQCHVFRQLLAYETLLKPEYRLRIQKIISDELFVLIIKTDKWASLAYAQTWAFDPHTIQTTKELDAALAKFWNEVPQKFKLEP